MIDWADYLHHTRATLGRRIQQDQGQLTVVQEGPDISMFVIAGPGTGKTTALALRILKLIFVDGLDPASILATTFTKKAAGELRSRILGWGDQLRRAFLQGAAPGLAEQLRRLDLNRVVTGTLDSLVEDVLTQWRVPGQQPPVVLEPFVAESRMLRALWSNGRHRNTDLAAYATYLNGDAVRGSKGLAKICDVVRGRFLHDQVDVPQYLAHTIPQYPGAGVLGAVVDQYDQDLRTGLVVDFPALENRFLTDVSAGLLDAFANQIRVVLVDEYQDTNLLQEQIYLALTGYAFNNGGSVVVVGDDDQSLYRFRGATVELFVAFPARVQQRFGYNPVTVPLSNNYRSTPNLVAYFSDFANLDPAYAPARVAGKPPLVAARGGPLVNFPVLGMFRPTVEELARDLARFVGEVFNGGGVTVNTPEGALQIIRDPTAGAVGDCALLCSSPAEYSSGDRPRLPLLIRQELVALPQPIEVFNPRGQAFAEIQVVAQLGGLLLECIDPAATVMGGLASYPQEVADVLTLWRGEAQAFIATNPAAPPRAAGARGAPNTLGAFVRAWQARRPQRRGATWPAEVSMLQLLYDLISWMPYLQHDPEGLVYAEVFTRTIMLSASDASYEGQIHRDPPHHDRSISQLYWNVFAPIAGGAIEVNEDLIEQLPADRFNILSIHQSKGLEFPLTIVDVSSDFRVKHWKQAFKRFPREPASAHRMEDEFRRFSPQLGPPQRAALERTFDDLVRLYFVAFSRAQDVLLLVGRGDPAQGPNPRIENVATGWRRDGQWPWAANPHLHLI